MQIRKRPCCIRWITFSFSRAWDSILTFGFDDAEFSKENKQKPGESGSLSSEDETKVMKDFYYNPDKWQKDPNGNPNTFKQIATFCDGSNKIERFGP